MLIAATALIRTGVEACADFLEVVAPRLPAFWLPLPAEVCAGRPTDLGPLERYLEPLVALYHTVEARWRCYGESLRSRALAASRLAALVAKARVFERVDLAEWNRLFSAVAPADPPTPSLAFSPPESSRVVICGAYPPTPVEAAVNYWKALPPEARLRLVGWIVEYISAVVDSASVDEAYFRVLQAGWRVAYREIRAMALSGN